MPGDLDFPLVHPQLRDACLAQAAQQPAGMLGFGGKKVREQVVWDLPSAKLLTRCRTDMSAATSERAFTSGTRLANARRHANSHHEDLADGAPARFFPGRIESVDCGNSA